MNTFDLPDLGEGLRDAQIVAWHVSVGDHVVMDQPLVSVETEKAVVEILSPQAGQVAQLYGQVGEIVAVGSALVRFDEDGQRGSESVVGELPHLSAQSDTTGSPTPASSGGRVQDQHSNVRAAPAVRQRARQRGVDLTSIAGSGPGGAITMRDIDEQQQSESDSQPLNADRETLSGTRRAMAGAMSAAGAQIVPASVCADADITHWGSIEDLMVRLVSAMVAGCTAQPELNVGYDGLSGERTLHKQVDIGIAVDTDHGLVVPVLRNAQALSPSDASSG